MTNRFCPTCNAEVEDAGGFCLLGHSLRATAPVASLAALRAEVDRAFEEARVQVAHATLGYQSPPGAPPAPPPTPAFDVTSEEHPGTDPIADFAPAPRMDWGPDRQGLLKRRG